MKTQSSYCFKFLEVGTNFFLSQSLSHSGRTSHKHHDLDSKS